MSKRGVTLVEVLMAVVLIGVGIASLMSALTAITRDYANASEREVMNRLAKEKYDELVATGEWINPADGEFEDARFEAYEWESFTEPTAVDTLESLTVTVRPIDGSDDSARATGVIFRPTSTEGVAL